MADSAGRPTGPGFDPFTDGALADPYPGYAWFREHEPVHWSDRLRSWVVFRHDDVAALFRDDTRLSSDRARAPRMRERPATGIRTVSSDPPAHTPVRAMLVASLGPLVRTAGPLVDGLVVHFLDRLSGAVERAVEDTTLAGEADLIAEFAHPLPIRVIGELLGVPAPDRPRFEDASRAVARGMDRLYAGEASAGLREIGAYFLELVQARRGTAGDDVVRRLLGAEHRGDRLTDLEVVALCTALVFGGHETTVNLLGNGLAALFAHPAELARLRAEPSLAPAAVEELLRFDSPAQLISRIVAVDFGLRGRRLRAGDSVLLAIGAANRDPAVFSDPDRLDVGRDPNPHLAFGLGTHACPGAQLSRLEVRAALPALLRRFPGLRGGTSAPVRRPTAVLRGLESLPVRIG